MQAFCGKLAGAEFRFETDSTELGRYADRHMDPLRAEVSRAPAVTSVLRWHEGQPPARKAVGLDLQRCLRVDRDLYVGGDQLFWFRVDDLRDLYLRFRWDNGHLQVEGDFYFRLGNGGFSDRLRRLVSPAGAMRRRRFTTLVYYMVYYPCWWWLEQMRDLHPIHAAGVELDGKLILLAGASGVGKSTLSVVLAAQPTARFLSDSFVLQAGIDVCAVPEPILLDEWSRQWVGQAISGLEAIDYPYVLDRRGYQFPPARRVTSGRAGLLVFPRRAPEPFVRRLSPDQGHQRLSASGMIINDLRRYFAFGAILEHLVPGGLVAHREANLARLTAEIPSYEIGLTSTMDSRDVTDSIGQLLAGQHLRVVSQQT